MDEVLVVVGPGVVADAALVGEVAEREFAALGVAGSVVHARDAARVASLLRPGAVVLPGPAGEVRELIGRPLGPVVWVDVERADGVEPGEEATHLHGRGVAGLTWGIRHAVHRLRHPARRRIPYGPHRDQWGDLYLPPDPATPDPAPSNPVPSHPGGALPPVVALIHGGYWRSIWAADLMEALCADLTGRGLAVWNLEYRRPDLHGWDATAEDVAAGLAALAGCGAPLDLGRLALAGHSAGAQLALRAAADGTPAALVLSLAGVLDLVEGDRRWASAGAVAAALGGPHAARPGRYAAASPLLRLPLGVPQLVVQGSADDLDLVDFGRRYAGAALRAGDEVTYLEMPGDHFDVITPGTPIWRAAAETLTSLL
ncbi:alpha/beta hydrolase [Nonomuraea sp. NPDC050783]|uniref:alpha/beta hydrolase n=1 Tax=Nonomuraea sp. NPDC050783 TaxID=3154634 RepID=UPI003466D892